MEYEFPKFIKYLGFTMSKSGGGGVKIIMPPPIFNSGGHAPRFLCY